MTRGHGCLFANAFRGPSRDGSIDPFSISMAPFKLSVAPRIGRTVLGVGDFTLQRGESNLVVALLGLDGSQGIG